MGGLLALCCFLFIVATLLKREDVGRLKKALRPIAAWWKDLADELNMPASVVPAIERAHGNNHTDCLRAFIVTWLNMNPTLETLCEALEELDGYIEEVDMANVASNLKDFEAEQVFNLVA